MGQDRASRRLLRQQVAEDLYPLLRLFADQPAPAQRRSYQAMDRIFHEPCAVPEQKVTVQEKSGNTGRQNPSDPDARYDGHQGPGYQVQIAETCPPDNEVQLIPCALPPTAILWSTRPSSGGWRAGGGNRRRRSFASGIAAAAASRVPTAASSAARAWASHTPREANF